MATNFIDKDLLNVGGYRRPDPGERPGISVRTVPEVGGDRMAKHKDEVSDQMSGAVSEIQRLRMKQEELEKEKNALEELTQKQGEYEAGKREIVEKLNRSMILLEKEESQANRMVELLSETRGKFQETLSDLKTINEEGWADHEFREQLSRALARVDAAKDTYKRALAKIDASSWHKAVSRSDILAEAPREASIPRDFGFWFKAGLAASLPLIVILLLLFVAYLIRSGMLFL